MDLITFTDQGIDIDAILVAKGLRMDPEALRVALRDGSVTRTVEKGEGDDAGRFRVTFFAKARRFRVIFTASGDILKTSSVPFSRKTSAS